MEELHIGIIGVGNMGTSHAERIYRNEIQGLKLAAVGLIGRRNGSNGRRRI